MLSLRKIDNMGLRPFSTGALAPWVPWESSPARIQYWLGGVRYQKELPNSMGLTMRSLSSSLTPSLESPPPAAG